MKTYTFRVVCYADARAGDEGEAREIVSDMFPVYPEEIELYEIEEDEPDWDAINDDRRLGIGRFEDE